ncbi:hypothetical protein [Salinactinospora qingdaonensis]|uniref:Uncharacterized protein n=1 Tax=Salinactinospora qingdaonensis TaxID=702744 RepID=A0ABP7FDV1_9ACTN
MPRISKGRKRGFLAALATACGVIAVTTTLYLVSDSTASSPGEEPLPPPRTVTGEERTVLHIAEQVLLRDCMRRNGFTYQIPTEPPPTTGRFPYVIDDVNWAEEHGYGSDIKSDIARMRKEDPNQRYFHGLPPERKAVALKAANGEAPHEITVENPDGLVLTRNDEGCQSEAERKLYGDLETWFEAKTTVDALESVRHERVITDPRFTEAVRPWAECMRAAGYPYESPARLREELKPIDAALPRDEEIRLATAEARCARSSGLAATARDLAREHRRELRHEHRSAITSKTRIQLAALPKARSIVAAIGIDL